MNEAVQTITYLLNSHAQKDALIKQLQDQVALLSPQTPQVENYKGKSEHKAA